MRKYGSIFILILLISSSLFSYDFINADKSDIRIDDGDTIVVGDTQLRVIGVDTPEILHLDHGIDESQYMGEEAREFTRKSIINAKTITYLPDKLDRYNRQLAHVFVDGKLLAAKIIKVGLGYETISVYGNSKYKKFDNMILYEASKVVSPSFKNPLYFRAEMRRRVK